MLDSGPKALLVLGAKLAEANLQKYAQQLIDMHGLANHHELADLEADDLQNLGMTKLEINRFKKLQEFYFQDDDESGDDHGESTGFI